MLVPLLLMQALIDLTAGEGGFAPKSSGAIEEALAHRLFEYEVLLEYNTGAQSLRASDPAGDDTLFAISGEDRIELRVFLDLRSERFFRRPEIINFRSIQSVTGVAPSPAGCTQASLSGDFELIEVKTAETIEKKKEILLGHSIILRGEHATGSVRLTCGARVIESTGLSRSDGFEMLLELPAPSLSAFRENGWWKNGVTGWTEARTFSVNDWTMTYRLRPPD